MVVGDGNSRIGGSVIGGSRSGGSRVGGSRLVVGVVLQTIYKSTMTTTR